MAIIEVCMLYRDIIFSEIALMCEGPKRVLYNDNQAQMHPSLCKAFHPVAVTMTSNV